MTSLKSTTIEWAVNLRICDLLQANPPLAVYVMPRCQERLCKDHPVSVLLALGLLEMIVKNCGFAACKYVDQGLADALLNVVKKREGWRYGLGRNLHKSVGGWLPHKLTIDEEERKLWLQASHKVLEMLQLWADAFMLQQTHLAPVFAVYKQLRQEGYKFPTTEQGASAGLCLITGAEQSPVFLAGACPPSSSSRAEAVPSPPSPPLTCSASPASIQCPPEGPSMEARWKRILEKTEATRLMLDDFRSERRPPDVVAHNVEEMRRELLQMAQEILEVPDVLVDEQVFNSIFTLVEEMDVMLPREAVTSPVPAPPSVAPPDREQQELNDEILARFLQAREDELEKQREAEDAALALRLSMEYAGQVSTSSSQVQRHHEVPMVVRCGTCTAINELEAGHRGGATPLSFVCYVCGSREVVRWDSVSSRATSSFSRAAPPPRVIAAGGGGPELFITAGGSEDLTDDIGGPHRHGPAARSAAPPGYQPPSAVSSESYCDNSAGEALLGKPVGRGAVQWAKSMGSWLASGSHATEKLGDGVPLAEYAELGDNDLLGAPLCGGPPRARHSALGSLSRNAGKLLSWRPGGSSSGDTESPLLDRVQVDGEWELIRPPDSKPYWYNTVTQASQWEPPDVVRKRMRA